MSRRGPKIAKAVLSGMLWYHNMTRPEYTDLRYKDGTIVRIPGGCFLVSIETIAANLWCRYFGDIITHRDAKEAEAWFRRARRGADDLVATGLVERVAPIAGGRKGTIWRMGRWANDISIVQCPDPRGLLMEWVDDTDYEDGLVNATDMIGRLLDPTVDCTHAESCPTVRKRGRYAYGKRLEAAMASKGKDSEHYISVARWPQGVARSGMLAGSPVSVPWLTFDVDGDGVEDSWGIALRILDGISSRIDLSKVVVSYTGGRGFHVRIPHELWGGPVYKTATVAFDVLTRWADDLADERIDPSVFRPRQPLRAIGSKRGDFYVRGWTADVLTGMSLTSVLTECTHFQPFFFPRSPALVPELAADFAEAVDAVRVQYDSVASGKRSRRLVNGTSPAVAAALQGVSESEEWHSGHVGRSKAAYIVALHLLNNRSYQDALVFLLDEWNPKNTPPLRESEITNALKSARKYIENTTLYAKAS